MTNPEPATSSSAAVAATATKYLSPSDWARIEDHALMAGDEEAARVAGEQLALCRGPSARQERWERGREGGAWVRAY